MKKDLKVIDKINFNVEVYTQEHTKFVENFNSGVVAFNDFIKKDALSDKELGEGVTYVVTNTINEKDKTIKEIVAYYTISTFAVQIMDDYDYEDDSIPDEKKRIHYSPISAFLINMFAVNKKYQDTTYDGTLISDLIFMNIINHLYDISTNLVGAKSIILCSVKDAVKFYKRNHFKEFDSGMTLLDKCIDDTVPMHLPLHKQ